MVENDESWERQGVLALDDIVVVTVTPSKSVELSPRHHLAGKTTWRGASAGIRAGLLGGGTIAGFVIGASVGALTGALRKPGPDDSLVRGNSARLRPNTSAHFLLVHDADVARIADEIRPYRTQLRYTTLPPEHARQLHDTLALEKSAIRPAQTVETPAGGPA